MVDDLAAVWTYFADTSCRAYSPLYDRICRAVAASEEVLAFVREAPPRGHQPNVLLAGVHYLLLDGRDHPLAQVYAGASDADPGALFVDFCLSHRAELRTLLATRHTNTNEVGRSAVLGPALTTAGARAGMPLALVDVGCSAGLNLYCDRYLLDYGDAGSTGPSDARVRVSCAIVGGRPPIAPHLPAFGARVGIDRSPLDLTDEDAVRWQLACVWPDTGRLARTRLALEELRRSPPRIVAGDAVETVGAVVESLPDDAHAVVMTTWMLMYLSREQRVAFREVLAVTSEVRPITWISGESPGVVDLFAGVDTPSGADGMEASVIGLALFRGGHLADSELLAFVHPHGNWLDWRAAPA